MNTHFRRAIAATFIAIAFSQCQSQPPIQDHARFASPSTPPANYPTIENKTVAFGGQKFAQQRNVVCAHPLETQIVSKEQ